MMFLYTIFAVLIALIFGSFLWRKSKFEYNVALLLGFLFTAILYTFFANKNLACGTSIELYPFSVLALGLCISTKNVKNHRKRNLVLAELFWLWLEFFGNLSLFYHGLNFNYIKIFAIAILTLMSVFFEKITKGTEFVLMLYWIFIFICF